MQLKIHAQNKFFTHALREYCEEKLSRPIRRHRLDNEGTFIDVDGEPVGEQIELRVRVSMPHTPTLNASSHHEDAYAAIDLLVDKVERQLKDYEERRRTLNRRKTDPEFLPKLEADDFFTEDEEDTLREIGALDAVIEA